GQIAGQRRLASGALAVMSVVIFVFAAVMGLTLTPLPPFDVFVLAPASVVAAITTPPSLPRRVLVALAIAYCVALALAIITNVTPDGPLNFRAFGVIAYATVGALWAAFGGVL